MAKKTGAIPAMKIPPAPTPKQQVDSKRRTQAPEPTPELSIPASLLVDTPAAVALLETMRTLRWEAKSLGSLLRLREGADAITVARTYVVLHHLNNCLDVACKEYTQIFERFKREVVPNAYDRDGVTHVPLQEGFRVGVSMPMRVSIREGQRDEAFKWLRDNNLGSLITDTVNSSTLAATAKSLLEDQGIELPPDTFNSAFIPTASVTRTKK